MTVVENVKGKMSEGMADVDNNYIEVVPTEEVRDREH